MYLHTQRHLILHGAIVLLVGLALGIPSVIEVAGGSARMWQAAHSALLMLGIWLIASAAVLPVLVLERREAMGLVWSLVIAGYSFMTAVIIQAMTGQRALSPDVASFGKIAFVANLIAVVSSFLAAALTATGAYHGLRQTRKDAARTAITRGILSVVFLTAFGVMHSAEGQQPRTVLAIGAHAGDAELTMGPVLSAERARGSRVVILDLTLGERGHPTLTASQYAAQKRSEAEAVARALGAELEIGPWQDAEIPNDENARRWVASVIRRVRPNLVLTHWKKSLHRDHATTSAIVQDALLLAALPGTTGVQGEPHRGVSMWYAENWEDAEDFKPYIYVAVDSASWMRWKDAVGNFAFARGATGFPYIDYYDALGRVRGIESRKGRAVAFDVEPYGKRRVLDAVP